MKASHFFSKLILSVLFMPAFIFSSDLNNLKNDLYINEDSPQSNFESLVRNCLPNHSRHKGSESVFASFRNDADQTIQADGNVKFNIEDANKGNGIHYHSGTGIFTVQRAGFYLINYGLASIGTAGETGVAFGASLTRTRNNQRLIVDSVLVDSSSAIILHLQKNDELSLVSPFKVILLAGSLAPRTTSFTDTAFMVFLRVDR